MARGRFVIGPVGESWTSTSPSATTSEMIKIPSISLWHPTVSAVSPCWTEQQHLVAEYISAESLTCSMTCLSSAHWSNTRLHQPLFLQETLKSKLILTKSKGLSLCLSAIFVFQGPDSHYGTKGMRKVTHESSSTGTKTCFTFCYAAGNNNGTSVEDGQIPEVIFYT